MPLTLPRDPLVSSAWLAAHLEHPQLRLIDVRGQHALRDGVFPQEPRVAYAAGHIPGACFIDWERHVLDQDDPVPSQLGTVEQLTALFGSLGIGVATRVVAYDDADDLVASLLQWVLRALGHEGVRVLDGGLARWLGEGRPCSTVAPLVLPAAFTPQPRPALQRQAAHLLERVRSPASSPTPALYPQLGSDLRARFGRN